MNSTKSRRRTTSSAPPRRWPWPRRLSPPVFPPIAWANSAPPSANISALPLAGTKNTAPFANWIPALRWLFAGSGAAAIAYALIIFAFANRTIEVGLYGSDLVRSGDQGLTASDVPAAKLVTFDQDTPFDQWQSTPLAWNERAKIWIDNEHDLLHVTHRVRHGQVVTETQPLAPTTAGQRDQIKQLVDSLQN